MRTFWYLVYNLVGVPVQYLGFRLIGLFNAKVRKGIHGRKRSSDTLQQFNAGRDKAQKCYIVHCASLGEYEMARPVIEGIKASEPDTDVVLTFFSPSGYDQVYDSSPADLVTYLPFDSVRRVTKFFTLLNPEKLILTSYEIWPNLIWTAKKYDVEVHLTSARLSEESKKTGPVFRSFFRTVYNDIQYIYPITAQDEQNFKSYFRLSESVEIHTLGNTRYDRVLERAVQAGEQPFLPENFRHQPTLIAGSIWPADNKVILPALESVKHAFPDLKLVLAPHELSRDHLRELQKWCDGRGLGCSYLNNGSADGNEVLIVDKIGVLAEIYHDGDIAFIGGAFSGSVHNVMEPAVAKCAVLFGPEYHNSDEAEQLIKSGGGFSLTGETEMEETLYRLLSDPDTLHSAQNAAYNIITSNAGATGKTVRHILKSS